MREEIPEKDAILLDKLDYAQCLASHTKDMVPSVMSSIEKGLGIGYSLASFLGTTPVAPIIDSNFCASYVDVNDFQTNLCALSKDPFYDFFSCSSYFS